MQDLGLTSVKIFRGLRRCVFEGTVGWKNCCIPEEPLPFAFTERCRFRFAEKSGI
jgi:hypothetical protein